MLEIKSRQLNDQEVLTTIFLKLRKNHLQPLYARIFKKIDHTEQELQWLNSLKSIPVHFE